MQNVSYTETCIPDKLERLFTFNSYIHSYERHCSNVFCIPKGNTTQFSTDISSSLIFDSTKQWNKFHLELLNKETSLPKF